MLILQTNAILQNCQCATNLVLYECCQLSVILLHNGFNDQIGTAHMHLKSYSKVGVCHTAARLSNIYGDRNTYNVILGEN